MDRLRPNRDNLEFPDFFGLKELQQEPIGQATLESLKGRNSRNVSLYDLLCRLPFARLTSAIRCEPYCRVPLVLLCHKSERRQQGHLGRARARWVAIWRRRVAMERGLCRSVLIGSAAGLRFARQVG
jgi:hypothetical protein